MWLLRTLLIGTWAVGSGLAAFIAVADEALPIEEVAPVLNKHACNAACKFVRFSTTYHLEPLDLDGDGVREYLIRTEECGSGGCAEGLFRRDGSGWKKLIGVSVGALELQNSRTNGFPDVAVLTSTSRTVYRWDGRKYQEK
jgi:hypothetical protein